MTNFMVICLIVIWAQKWIYFMIPFIFIPLWLHFYCLNGLFAISLWLRWVYFSAVLSWFCSPECPHGCFSAQRSNRGVDDSVPSVNKQKQPLAIRNELKLLINPGKVGHFNHSFIYILFEWNKYNNRFNY